MFVSPHYSYLVVSPTGLKQKFLCGFYDDDNLPPATAEDMQAAGYDIHHGDEGAIHFSKSGKGFLSSQPSLILSHSPGVDRCETFRFVDPEILPEPLPVISEKPSIAKTLHQVGIFRHDPGSYPEVYTENRNRIISMNPSYKYYYWSEGGGNEISDFIEAHYGPKVLKYYQCINPLYPAARCDFFRHMCLYAVGGVYFDLKTSFAYPLNKVIRPNDRFILSHWYHGAQGHHEIEHIPYGEYEQYYVMCAAGHPLMRKIVQQILCNITVYRSYFNGVGFYGNLRFLGPLMFAMIVHEYRDRYSEGIRRIHSSSNGIEFTIFRDNAVHRRKGGGTHYGDQEAPLIEEEVRQELLFRE